MDELDATLESVRQALEGARDAGSAQSEAAADFVASLAASSPPGSELLSGLASQLPAACELGFASPR